MGSQVAYDRKVDLSPITVEKLSGYKNITEHLTQETLNLTVI